jgi:hypothetical protein
MSFFGSTEPLCVSGSALVADALGFGAEGGVSLSLLRRVKNFFSRPNMLCRFLWTGRVRVSSIVKTGDRLFEP